MHEAIMLAMPTQLEIYREMRRLASCMVDAARAQDWDRLIALERNVAALRDQLAREAKEEAGPPEEIEEKRALIRAILADDAEIRRHTEPWMEQVRRYLTGRLNQDKVERAYGAGD
ncbi:MAG: flagellar protein FliT [Rhodocyclaceae bacterium]|nr:flagellar protein FliT [Rhodocyclaceae bacterium]